MLLLEASQAGQSVQWVPGSEATELSHGRQLLFSFGVSEDCAKP